MDACVDRFLRSADVRDFLFRRRPEGVLPRHVLSTAVSYAYAGGQTSPHVSVPAVQDSFVLHKVTDDGFALGEMLSCSEVHPFVPTLNSVVAASGIGQPFATSPVSRRFAIDLNGANYNEFVEFAWMSDSRLLVVWRWTSAHANSPWVLGGEISIYPPTPDGTFFSPMNFPPELRMVASAQLCISCGASHQSHCVCPPSVVRNDTLSIASSYLGDVQPPPDSAQLRSVGNMRAPPIRQMVGRTWAQYCDFFTSSRTMGSLRVSYRTGKCAPGSLVSAGIDKETVLMEGAVPYGVSYMHGFPGDAEFKQQIYVYMKMAGMTFPLSDEPKLTSDTAALLLLDHDQTVHGPTDAVGGNQVELEWGNDGEQLVADGNLNAVNNVSNTIPQTLNTDIVPCPLPAEGPCSPSDYTHIDARGNSSNSAARSAEVTKVPSGKPIAAKSNLAGSDQGGSGPSTAYSAADESKQNKKAYAGDSNTVCSICGAKFTRPSNLRRHRQSLHMQVKKAHQCRQCDRSFFSAVELRRHVAKHDAPRPECAQCGLRFRLTSALNLHIAVAHSNERPFKCECGAAFARKSALDRHRRSVHQGHRHSCPDCNASYSQPFDLKRHKSRTGHGREVKGDGSGSGDGQYRGGDGQYSGGDGVGGDVGDGDGCSRGDDGDDDHDPVGGIFPESVVGLDILGGHGNSKTHGGGSVVLGGIADKVTVQNASLGSHALSSGPGLGRG